MMNTNTHDATNVANIKLDKSRRKCYHFNVCGSPRQPMMMGVEELRLKMKSQEG